MFLGSLRSYSLTRGSSEVSWFLGRFDTLIVYSGRLILYCSLKRSVYRLRRGLDSLRGRLISSLVNVLVRVLFVYVLVDVLATFLLSIITSIFDNVLYRFLSDS